MTVLISYWIITTIIAVRWVIKNPSSKFGDHDQVHFTLLEVAGKIFPCACATSEYEMGYIVLNNTIGDASFNRIIADVLF